MGNFYSDILIKNPEFHTMRGVTALELLEPLTRAAIQAVIHDAAVLGKTLVVLETYRSRERQKILFERGASKLRDVGVHHYGLACDLGLIDGRTHYDPCGEHYGFLADLTRRRGLVWGGDWGEPDRPHRFRDYGHVQRIRVSEQKKLFSGEWYPDASYCAFAPQKSPVSSPQPKSTQPKSAPPVNKKTSQKAPANKTG